MNINITIYNYICAPDVFTINGVKADYRDFGEKADRDPENAEEYGCGDMRFIGKAHSREVLDKYHITESEYVEVVAELERKLSFGNCVCCS